MHRIRHVERATLAGAVLLVTAMVGWSARSGSLLPVVVAGVIVLADIAIARSFVGVGRGGEGAHRLVPPLAAAWLVVALFPVHNFARRSNFDAVRQVGVQPVVELLAFGLAAALGLVVVRAFEPTAVRARPPVSLMLLPLWVMASGLWSDTGPYALVRGTQMLCAALLAWGTVALGRSDADALETLVACVLRWFVWVTVALVAAGAAFGPIYVPANPENLERFTWIGAHPNGAGIVLALALVIVVTASTATLRLPARARAAMILVLGTSLYANHSRTSWLCVAIGLLAAFVLAARTRQRFRWLGSPVLVVGLGTVVLLAGPAIGDYLLRGGTSSTLRGGNGRFALWEIGTDALVTPFDWMAGLGYGTARTLFAAQLSWAVSAHSSILALLVSVGLVGIGLFVVLLVGTVRGIAVGRVPSTARDGIAVASILVAVLVNGLASDVLAEPNIGFAIVALVAAVGIVARERRASSAQPPFVGASNAGGASTPRPRAAARSSSSSISTQASLGARTSS
jgi:O-antigen ligase